MTSQTDKIVIEEKIPRNLIEASHYNDIKVGLYSRNFWKFTGHSVGAISHLFHGAATILTFTAGFYGSPLLSYIGGVCNIVCMIMQKCSNYSDTQSIMRTEEINVSMKELEKEKI